MEHNFRPTINKLVNSYYQDTAQTFTTRQIAEIVVRIDGFNPDNLLNIIEQVQQTVRNTLWNKTNDNGERLWIHSGTPDYIWVWGDLATTEHRELFVEYLRLRRDEHLAIYDIEHRKLRRIKRNHLQLVKERYAA